MVHQHFLLVDTLTVAENVVLGLERRPLLGVLPADAERRVAELSRRCTCAWTRTRRVAGLSWASSSASRSSRCSIAARAC
jgi:simple sugar transport system ATP-binding protein